MSIAEIKFIVGFIGLIATEVGLVWYMIKSKFPRDAAMGIVGLWVWLYAIAFMYFVL